MKTNKETLVNALYFIVQNYNANKKIISQVVEDLSNKGIAIGEVQRILNGNIAFETITDPKLYLLTKSLYIATEEEKINPNHFFTPEEIKSGDNFSFNIEENSSDVLELDGVLQVDDDHFCTTLTYKQIADLYAKGLVCYNYETQRQAKHFMKEDKLIQKPELNTTSVIEIEELMLNKLYVADAITFNFKSDYEYLDKSYRMKIFKPSFDITDGFHRSSSIIDVVQKDPSIDKKMVIYFTTFDDIKSRRMIGQKNKRNPINKRYEKSIDQNNKANIIVQKINESPNCELRGKITTSLTVLNNNYAYVLNDTLSESIENFFVIKTQRDLDKINNYLIDGFNEIVGIYFNEFANLEQSKTNNYITYNSMFIFYTAVLRHLYEVKNWKKELEIILQKIDFNKPNSIWNDLDIESNTVGKVKLRKINEYAKSLTKGVEINV